MIATEPRRLRRSLTTAAALVLLAVPLSACTSAGTDFIYTPAQGVNARDGDVDVLNALVVSSEDGEGRLVVGLANNDTSEPDGLTGVAGAGEDTSLQVQLEGGETQIEPGGFLQLADPEAARVIVSGDGVQPGDLVRLSLQFEKADAVEVHVPVVEPGDDFAGVMSSPAAPSEPASPEESAGPSPTQGATEDE